MAGEKWYEIYRSYWKDDAYADSFTKSACQGTGSFGESVSPLISTTSRGEGCKKGSAYQNVWMYVIHEMEACISDCKSGIIGKHWDEAVAFYSGSLIGTDGSESIGVMPFGLAERRCTNFGTCDGDNDDQSSYQSLVNDHIFDLFNAGKEYQLTLQCNQLESTKEAIVTKMAIPLIQATFRYLYLADLQETEKERAELWAFAAAVLPYINYFDADTAAMVRANSEITNQVTVPSGYAEVKQAIESQYSAMGITCADVGGLVSVTSSTGYFAGMEPCSDASTTGGSTSNGGDDDSIPDYGIALLVILLTFAVLGSIFAIYYYRKSSELHIRLNETEGMLNKGDDRVVAHTNDV